MKARTTPIVILVSLLMAPIVARAQMQNGAPDPPQPAALASETFTPPATSDASAKLAFLPLPHVGGWVSVTKWLSLGTAAGLGALGFSIKSDANDLFQRLERRCENSGDLCRQRRADGAYADAGLENLFQRVRSRDHEAQLSLIGAQVTFAFSVALFIADLQRGQGPGNIPYDPNTDKSRLQLTAVPGEVALRFYLQ